MLKPRAHGISILSFFLILSCGAPKKDFKSSQNPEQVTAQNGEEAVKKPGSNNLDVMIDDRTIEQVLCQEGPKVAAEVNKADFTPQFNIVCADGDTNAFFGTLIQEAHAGNGEPKIQLVRSTTDDLYVTNIAFAYAMKVPLENPSLFADLKAHDIFAQGVKRENSELLVTVDSRQSFPGARSVEQVVLNYDLSNANGAGIFDKRQTEFNTYILIEDNRDVTISTEHLLDPDNNEYYHSANGLMLGIKDGKGQTYLVFITELTIKNRIDPKRMEVTLTHLNTQVASMLYQHIAGSTP